MQCSILMPPSLCRATEKPYELNLMCHFRFFILCQYFKKSKRAPRLMLLMGPKGVLCFYPPGNDKPPDYNYVHKQLVIFCFRKIEHIFM